MIRGRRRPRTTAARQHASQPTQRRHRWAEGGFTLIEVVVSSAVLAIISGALAAAYTLALRTIATNPQSTCAVSAGCPTDRLAAAHDVSVFEQLLGRDGARAACVEVPSLKPSEEVQQWGSCVAGFSEVTACAEAAACFGWPQVSDSSCHVAVYSTTGSTQKLSASRTEYSVPMASGVASPVFATPITSGTVALAFPPSGFVALLTAPGGYQWVRTLTVQVTPTGIANGHPQTIAIHPLATDPDGPAAAITALGKPC